MTGYDEEPGTDSAPLLELDGVTFRCRPSVPGWATMKLASAYVKKNDLFTLAAIHDFLALAVEPADWPAFEEHVMEHDTSVSDLDDAVGDLLAQMGGRGKGSKESSDSSSGGSPSPTTSLSSRVVSLSQGTVEVVPADSAEPTSSTG